MVNGYFLLLIKLNCIIYKMSILYHICIPIHVIIEDILTNVTTFQSQPLQTKHNHNILDRSKR